MSTHHLLIPLPNLRTIGIDVMARHLAHLLLGRCEAFVDVVVALGLRLGDGSGG